MACMQINDARKLFSPELGWLNTASYGLPPTAAWDALQAALGDWRAGRTTWEPWGDAVATARDTFARLVGAAPSNVSIGAQVSQLIAPIASSLPTGSLVLVPAEEFTSNVFPWAAQEARGIGVVAAPADRLAEAIDASVDLVAFSLVQSATGAVADVDAIVTAAEAVGAVTVADATQACGWLPVDATRFDAFVCSAYKWLLSPRGTGFLVTSPLLRERIVPSQAGWFAAADPYDAYYGLPLRLAPDARALDISPAWFNWVATAPALAVLEEVGIEAIRDHDVTLANRFRAGLGLPPGDSAIVSADVPDAEPRLAAAGIRAAGRGGKLRASFHLYNTEQDVDRALDALTHR